MVDQGPARMRLKSSTLIPSSAPIISPVAVRDLECSSTNASKRTAEALRRCGSNGDGQALDLLEYLPCHALPAIAAIIAQRPLMPIRRQAYAGIGGYRHQVTQVAGVAHRRIDALVGQASGDDQKAGA